MGSLFSLCPDATGPVSRLGLSVPRALLVHIDEPGNFF